MKILEILSKQHTAPELRGKSKPEILRELATIVANGHAELDVDRLVGVLEEREKLGSTAIGDGIAIPHGKMPNLKNVIAAFGRSPEGVPFDSLDGDPTRMFFLLVAPEDSSGAHLKALARISRLLRNEDFRGRLLAASTRDELFEAIREEDEKY